MSLVYVYWLRPNLSNYWNVEIVKYTKKKDVFRRGSSLEIYTSAAVSKMPKILKLCFFSMKLPKKLLH